MQGHAFISYVREDEAVVKKLQHASQQLAAAAQPAGVYGLPSDEVLGRSDVTELASIRVGTEMHPDCPG